MLHTDVGLNTGNTGNTVYSGNPTRHWNRYDYFIFPDFSQRKKRWMSQILNWDLNTYRANEYQNIQLFGQSTNQCSAPLYLQYFECCELGVGGNTVCISVIIYILSPKVSQIRTKLKSSGFHCKVILFGRQLTTVTCTTLETAWQQSSRSTT